MELDKFLADRQPQPAAVRQLLFVQTVKCLKGPVQLFRRNPTSAVLHQNRHFCLGEHGGDPHPPLFGVTHRIGEQVEQNLANPHPIQVDRARRRGSFQLQIEVARLCQPTHNLSGFLQQDIEVNTFLLQHKTPRLDL